MSPLDFWRLVAVIVVAFIVIQFLPVVAYLLLAVVTPWG